MYSWPNRQKVASFQWLFYNTLHFVQKCSAIACNHSGSLQWCMLGWPWRQLFNRKELSSPACNNHIWIVASRTGCSLSNAHTTDWLVAHPLRTEWHQILYHFNCRDKRLSSKTTLPPKLVPCATIAKHYVGAVSQFTTRPALSEVTYPGLQINRVVTVEVYAEKSVDYWLVQCYMLQIRTISCDVDEEFI